MGDAAQQLLHRVRATIAKYHMLAPGETVLAAVSGGPDSICLLHALAELGYHLHIAHFDHQTRGHKSAEDAEFVRDVAVRFGSPFHLESRPIEEEAAEVGESFEAYARGARYSFFRRVADSTGCTAIATGHHADDRAETVLMRLLRGTWPGGLGAIPPVRNNGDGRRVVRPLIECTREEIMAFLADGSIGYCEDETNASMQHTRNRVRHELMPELVEKYNPRLRDALCRLAEMQYDANDVIRQRTGELILACYHDAAIDLVEFARGPIACQRELLADCAERNGIDIEFDRIERARLFVLQGPQHKYFDFGNGVMLRNERGTTYILDAARQADDGATELQLPGATPAMGLVFHCRILEQAPAMPIRGLCNASRQIFDADRVNGAVSVRARRDGDRFTPLGMEQPKKIQDYMVDRKVDQPLRDAVPLVCVDDRIAWVVGHTIDASVAVTDDTKRYLLIEVEDALE
ncbi:MAG: tRNA lysidine(34) synthetase TilS [Candidatus Hydrogenedentes bacterium]|nr:tRNA lysidine(34) synthetase TilS [Candidatus Hydrogenedentota bacterium]